MLTSSPSPQLNPNTTSSYTSSHRKSPYAFRASTRNTIASLSPHSNSHSSPAARQSGSASPSKKRPPTGAPPPGFRSPKRPTSDAATQYSPTGSPPTARARPTAETHQPEEPRDVGEGTEATIAGHESPSAASAAQDAPPEPPPAPRVRETPGSTLAAAASAENSRSVSPSVPGSAQHAAKRQRQTDGERKVVPAQYDQCEPKILASMIATMLMTLIHHNDTLNNDEVHLTRFHSRTPPGISVHDYMQRLTHHATLPSPVLLAMVNYIDKLSEAYNVFTVNSLTVHRFLIAAATVAAKGLCDVFWTNSLYAKVGGVSKKELALLELELLIQTEWRIIPDLDKLQAYYEDMVKKSGEYVIEVESSAASSASAASSDSIGTDTMDTD